MKNRLNPFFGTLAVIAITQAAHAASATWNGTTNAIWATDSNWSASPAPGTGDTATFDNAGGADDVIDLVGGVIIKDILFDTSAAAYTIGSLGTQELILNHGGTISASSTIAANQLFNAKLVLGTDAAGGSYTNRDGEHLPQINIQFAVMEPGTIPVALRMVEGSVPDVSTLLNTL